MLGILLALASAISWGSGDFSGGLAARRHSSFQVVALASLVGLLFTLTFTVLRRESLPTREGMLWSIGAGVSGFIGIAALYRGLSLGDTSRVAPTAGVVGAIVPILYGALAQGSPGGVRAVGFVFGLIGIWFVTQPDSGRNLGWGRGSVLALVAGLGFGGFYVLIALSGPRLVFSPLVLAKGVSLFAGLVVVLIARQSLPSPTASPFALLAGLLDVGGNVLYLAAKEFTRLDVAAVLSSLYPAVTVLLASKLLKEIVTRRQWFGLALCLAALGLIAL